MLSCGRHCYYPVAGQFWNGQVRAYNPPADEDHPRGPEPVDTIPVTTDTVLVNPYIIQVPRLRNPPPPPPQLDTGSAIWKYAAPSITPTPSIWSPAIPVVFGDLKPHESVITLPMDSDEHGTNVRLLKLITVTTSEHSTATILVMPQETTVTTSLPPATTTALVHKETTVTTSLSPATTTAVIQQEVTVTTSEPPITTTALLHQDFTVTTSQPSTTTTTALAVKEVLVSDPIAVEIKLPVPIPAPGPLQRFSSRPPRKSHPVITASKDPNYSELPEPTNLPRYRSESQTPYEDFWAIQRNKPKGPPVKLGTRAATTQPIITPGPTSSPWSAVKAPQHRGDAGVWTRYGPGWEWKRIEAAGVATPVPGKPSCPDSRTMLKNEHVSGVFE